MGFNDVLLLAAIVCDYNVALVAPLGDSNEQVYTDRVEMIGSDGAKL